MSPIPLANGIEPPSGVGGREGDPVLRGIVDELLDAVKAGKLHNVQGLIKRIVPEYQEPEEEAKERGRTRHSPVPQGVMAK